MPGFQRIAHFQQFLVVPVLQHPAEGLDLLARRVAYGVVASGLPERLAGQVRIDAFRLVAKLCVLRDRMALAKPFAAILTPALMQEDRKSTRLNSSHQKIS